MYFVHVLLLPYPSHGHVTPTLPVARELLVRGHRVTYAVTGAVADAPARAGAAVIRYDSPLTSESTGTIEEQLAGDRPDRIAYDATVCAPGRVLSRKWRVPAYRLVISGFLASNGIDPAGTDPVTAGERSVVFLPRSFQPCGDTFGDDHAFVGPCLGPEESTVGWTPPADGRPVVGVSLGTVGNDHPEFFRACAAAFEGTDWHVVIATGGAADTGGFGENVEVRPWLPDSAVLPHADVFVSPAGMAGIMRAGYHETPLVVVPYRPEQRINAARAVELGLARRLHPAELTAETLREAVFDIARDPAVRARLRGLRADIESAGGAARAADFITAGAEQQPVELPRVRSRAFDPPDGYAELPAVQALTFPRGRDGWLVTRRAEAKAVLADPRFSHRSELLASPLPPPFPLPPGDHPSPAAEPGAFNKMDAPQHTHYRRLVGHHLSPRRADAYQPEIAKAAGELLDAMATHGAPADLVRDYARPLPARIIFDLLGVPEDIRDPLQDNLDVMMHLSMSLDELVESVGVVGDLLDELVTKRQYGAGILDDLARAGQLDEIELRNIAWALLGGGTDTTANMIALGTLALLEHPAQLAALLAEPDLIDNTIEELLRYLTISQFGASRCALEDVDLAGRQVKAGQTVVVALPAVNRDPDRFPAPHELDVFRDTRGHLAFGHGVHKCIGQYLARATLRVAYPALFDRFPGLRLAVPANELRMRDDMDHYGVHELPVAW